MAENVYELCLKNSLLSQILYELRHIEIQQNRMLFRNNLKKFGQICAYEISKFLDYKESNIETVLGEARSYEIGSQIVICPILRAGLAMYDGLIDFFPRAESGFISAYRKHDMEGNFEIKLSYMTCPQIENKFLIIVDPMLATGASIEQSLKELKIYGNPSKIMIASVIASKEGIEHISQKYPKIFIFVGAIDEELTARSYIVPGLGDAGDLSYGLKLQD